MIAVIGLIIGIALGVLLDPTVPAWLTPFLPVAVVAGLDALFGAGRAWLEGRFADRVFVTSFFWNVVVACLLSIALVRGATGDYLSAAQSVTGMTVSTKSVDTLSMTGLSPAIAQYATPLSTHSEGDPQ